MKRVLFVCTGNTCRSPLAEGLLRLAAKERGIPIEVRSAGVSAMRGAPVSQHSAAILKERGEAPEGKSAEQLSAEHVAWADLILTMTMNHKRVIVHLHPDAMEKTFTLKEYAYAGDEHTEQLSAERSELLAELTTKKLLGQPITDEEQVRLQEIDRQLPNLDVDDPFGGPLSVYRECADELAVEIVKTIEKLSAE